MFFSPGTHPPQPRRTFLSKRGGKKEHNKLETQIRCSVDDNDGCLDTANEMVR